MTKMSRRSLIDVVSFIVDNRGRSCPTSDSGFPLIATNCLKDGRREPVFENVRYVNEEVYSNWFRAHPVPGDILFVCKGSPGRVAIVPDPVPFCIAQDMVALRARREIIHPLYLYYRLRSPDVQAAIANMHVGTMIPHFKKGDFGKLKFAIADAVSEQVAVAEILGALDDKIAANDRATELIVSLADAEFALAASDVLVGPATFEEIAEIGGGGTPKTSIDDFWGGDIYWATPTDVTGLRAPYLSRTNRTITEIGLASCSSRLYPAGSILMTSRATIGAFALARVPLAVNQGFIVVNARDQINQWWLFHEMRARVDEFLSHANGATFLELPRGKFKKLKLRMPTVEQAHVFASKVGPLHDMAAQMMAETAMLAATRDELLPLLMSGRVRVRDAEKIVEEVI